MKTLILAAVAALFAGGAVAQTPTPVPLNVEIPELSGVTRDPTCGNRPAVAQQAVCVTTSQAALGGVVDSLSAAFAEQDWIEAGGSDNLVLYVKRRPEGGCDGFQMLAFADTQLAAPAAPAWLAFAAIPGNVCADPATGSETSAPTQ